MHPHPLGVLTWPNGQQLTANAVSSGFDAARKRSEQFRAPSGTLGRFRAAPALSISFRRCRA
eukprot:5967965-Alexandrium_andersonii.AAC.1